ncbi:MAG: preprotein translocase subunit SecA [Muribaculaceae bacterium]|nr:preprotein translocase subunit SecA [Muribaculaceae bacterium]
MSFTNFLTKLFGNKAQRDLKEVQPKVDKINELGKQYANLSEDELREKIAVIRTDIAKTANEYQTKIDELKEKVEELPFDKRQPLWKEIDETQEKKIKSIDSKLDEVLPEVFAIMRETAARFAKKEEIVVKATELDRTLAAKGHDFVRIEDDKAIWKTSWLAGGNQIKWDMIHYDVQLIGGIILHEGKIAEMATGEGKTLVATLPVFLRSLSGQGVHVVTVNDYLAKRDSEWMGPLYMFHGSTVDCIDKHQPNTKERRDAYLCDITFGTNNEFGFDYLRDNIAMSPDDLVQRNHYYAIVDEVDSVLIDDARTPLIISGPVERGDDQMFDQFKDQVKRLVEAQQRLITPILVKAKEKLDSDSKEDQKEGAELLLRAYKGLPKNPALIKFLSQDQNKKILLDTENKYLENNASEMHIITDPLYFIIDEKNRSVELTDKGIDELTGKTQDPHFFVLPPITEELSEIETISDPAERQRRKDAVMQDYAIKTERVHTVTQLLKAYSLFEKDVEYVIDDNKIKIVDEQTGRIMEGRRYSDGLHQAIEAKEGVKVEAATQTIATITLQNYFRMYHKLAGMTGTAETEAGEFWDIYKLEVVTIPTNRPVARIDLNDRIYWTKREKYKAIIDEIIRLHKIGRPVLVGTTSVEISELISRLLTLNHIKHNVLNARHHKKEADIVALAGLPGAVTIATNMAGRGTDIKLTDVVKNTKDDEITDKKGNGIGGLAIIGTERHESRRVDRQLRGRAGRQGDEGSSVFYVSFEDQLMRLFTADNAITKILKNQFKEGERLENSMVTKAIENAQKRVEENNYGIRKRLLEYDDVMNTQRTYIYALRQHANSGERIGVDIENMLDNVCENIVHDYSGPEDYSELSLELLRILSIEPPFTEEEFRSLSVKEKTEMVRKAAEEARERQSDRITEIAMPIIKDWVENRGATGKIRVPITDGKRIYGITADITEAYKTNCRSIVKEWSKVVLMTTLDKLWKVYLREMDQLRQSVQNASYEQKDPLVIYKVESFKMFESLLNDLNVQTLSKLLRGQIYIQPAPAQQPADNVSTTADSGVRQHVKPEVRLPDVQKAEPERRTDYSRYSAAKAEDPAAAQRAVASRTQAPSAPTPVKVGPRVGRNDPCPCGSGKKYKNCHGKGK